MNEDEGDVPTLDSVDDVIGGEVNCKDVRIAQWLTRQVYQSDDQKMVTNLKL